MQQAGLTGKTTLPYVSVIGPAKGRVVGSQSADMTNHWRLDYDPDSEKGFHVNWRRIYKDKQGNCVMETGAVIAPGGRVAYLQQMERMPKL